MNENIDLTEILKDCPKGTEFYSCIYGKVRFDCLQSCEYPVLIMRGDGLYASFSRVGKYTDAPDSECCLFPSKDQRDWSKFAAPWYKKVKFDPKTLQPFDKVLVYDIYDICEGWTCALFSHIRESEYPYSTSSGSFKVCIPYNDETKHLLGTTEEAPEYYKCFDD